MTGLGEIRRQFGLLKIWFFLYLMLWPLGMYQAAKYGHKDLLIICLFPYVVAVAYAYRLQKWLNRAKLYRHGAWQVIVGAVIMNPYAIGFLIPLSVIYVTRRKLRDLI